MSTAALRTLVQNAAIIAGEAGVANATSIYTLTVIAAIVRAEFHVTHGSTPAFVTQAFPFFRARPVLRTIPWTFSLVAGIASEERLTHAFPSLVVGSRPFCFLDEIDSIF
jgi:hypothetical protein